MSIDPIVQGRITAQVQAAVTGYFEIASIQFDKPFAMSQHAVRVAGRFYADTERAYDSISRQLRDHGLTVFFRREGEDEVIYVAPGSLPVARTRWAVAAVLFVATLASVFFTGAVLLVDAEAGGSLDWRSGLYFAVPLMLILGAHELGHFLVGRRNGMAMSPPLFIPLPLSILGTLGAVIVMAAPPKNRKHLLQMGAAGPLAGLLFAVPLLIYGLATSPVQPLPSGPYFMEGNSLAYAFLKLLMFGQTLPSAEGLDVHLNNIAFAAWAGLLVTALNLIPAGQLDGGHAVYTLFGQRIRWLTYVLIAVLLGLGLWTGFWAWLIWAGLLFVFGRVYAVPMDDLTRLDRQHKALAAAMLVLWVLLFVPLPLQVVTP